MLLSGEYKCSNIDSQKNYDIFFLDMCDSLSRGISRILDLRIEYREDVTFSNFVSRIYVNFRVEGA